MANLPALRPWLNEPLVTYASAKLVWQHIARLPHKYILVGDNNHTDIRVQTAFWVGMYHSLEVGGPRHICLETDHKHQPVANYCSHRQILRCEVTPLTLQHWYAIAAPSLDGYQRLHVAKTAAITMSKNAARNPRVYCLNTLYLHQNTAAEADWSRLAERHMGDLAANRAGLCTRFKHLLQLYFEDFLPLRHRLTLKARIKEQSSYNMNLDPARAAMFQNATGQERGVLFYGARHLSSHDNRNITHWLPHDEQIVVMIGGQHLPNQYDPSGRASPNYDFYIDSKTGTAAITQRAVNRGLWPTA